MGTSRTYVAFLSSSSAIPIVPLLLCHRTIKAHGKKKSAMCKHDNRVRLVLSAELVANLRI